MRRAILFFLAAVAALAQTAVVGPSWTDDGKTLATQRTLVGGTLGAETVVNGTFTADASWTKDTGWSISGGMANAAASSAGLYQDDGLVAGGIYKVTYTILNYVSGGVYADAGSGAIATTRNANGTYTEYMVRGLNTFVAIYGSAFTGSVANVSVKLLSGGQLYLGGPLTVSGVLTATSNLILSGGFNAPLVTPASSSAACSAGDRAADANYVYICVATNTWKRVAIATW